ncbi:MAG: flagellar basal body P-ring protein FlgI [Betaproteobacteria bacterium]|nr:flagellar basal body P-ring protein FlgI [Betaproteobacteria bacterium]
MIRILAAVLALAAGPAHAERLKDVASVQGVRANPLVGYGLVVGLDGSGDQTAQTPFTTQSLTAMLAQLGVNLPPGQALQLKNVAAVLVTASLPAFARPGQSLDVTVSSLGNAKSLKGGTLILTPLKGADREVYAVAQGNLVIAGAGASAGGSKAQVNHLAAGRIPGGALVERAVASSFALGPDVRLELHATDFTLARRVAEAIDSQWTPGTARAVDGRVIQVRAPDAPEERVAFLAKLEEITVESAAPAAKVILNARTGSIVMNQSVALRPAAVAHGNLSVTINATPEVSQPNAFARGETVVTQKTDIQIKQEGGQLATLEASAKLSDVVRGLNTLGATPQDLLAILQALHASGALRAELEIL